MLFFWGLLSLSSAWAGIEAAYNNSLPLTQAECGAKDFGPQLGPVRNQEKAEWCWAMTGADLIGYSLGLGRRQQISAVDLIQSCAQFSPAKLPKPEGPLEEEHYRNIDLDQAKGVEEWRKENKGARLVDLKGYSLYATFCFNQRASFCSEPDLPAKDFLHSEMKFGDPEFEKLRAEKCGKQIPVRTLYTDFRRFKPGSNSSVAQMVAAWFRLNSPVSVAYRKSFFLEKEKGGAGPDHESIVTAMRWGAGACEFLVRNSWGDECKGFRKEFRDRCTGQGTWLSEKELKNSVFLAVRIFRPAKPGSSLIPKK